MKNLAYLCVLCCLIGLTSFAYAQEKECQKLHEGTFMYGDAANLTKVVIKGKKHTEYHDGGKYIIKSKLKWVNDCEYNMTLKKVTIPNFPYAKGAVMNVKIDKVEEETIFYTSSVEDETWPGMLVKVE